MTTSNVNYVTRLIFIVNKSKRLANPPFFVILSVSLLFEVGDISSFLSLNCTRLNNTGLRKLFLLRFLSLKFRQKVFES